MPFQHLAASYTAVAAHRRAHAAEASHTAVAAYKRKQAADDLEALRGSILAARERFVRDVVAAFESKDLVSLDSKDVDRDGRVHLVRIAHGDEYEDTGMSYGTVMYPGLSGVQPMALLLEEALSPFRVCISCGDDTTWHIHAWLARDPVAECAPGSTRPRLMVFVNRPLKG